MDRDPSPPAGLGNGSALGGFNGFVRLSDGTNLPYIASPRPLWYSLLNGSSEPGNSAIDDLHARIVDASAALSVRPLFLSVQSLGFSAQPNPPGTWGGLLGAAVAMSQRLGARFEVIGADDMVALATAAMNDDKATTV